MISDHIGHDVEVVTYANGHNGNASIECNDCHEVLSWEEKDQGNPNLTPQGRHTMCDVKIIPIGLCNSILNFNPKYLA